MSRVMSVAGLAGVVLVMAAAAPAQAQEIEVSGNVSIANDYAFRGISQTLEEPALQGGLDLGFPMGFYAGVWGSSVNFGEDLGAGPRAQLELDGYAGIAPTVGPLALDLGGIYYTYPGAADGRNYNFFEVYGSAGVEAGPVGVGVSGAYSPDFFAGSGTGFFGGAEASAGIPDTPFGLSGSFGRQWIETNANFGTPDYSVWSAGASADVSGFGLGASVVGTSLDEDECFGGSELCGTRLIVSVGRSL